MHGVLSRVASAWQQPEWTIVSAVPFKEVSEPPTLSLSLSLSLGVGGGARVGGGGGDRERDVDEVALAVGEGRVARAA